MKICKLCLWIAFLLSAGCNTDKNNIVLHVNNEPVTLSELEFFKALSKAEVAGYFFREYGVQQNANFWENKYGQESPAEKLKEVAIEKLVEYKVQQLLAKELGLIENIGFDELMSELKSFNENRKIRHEAGEPIYGPKQFTTGTYFDYVFDKMVSDVKQHLLNNYSCRVIHDATDAKSQHVIPSENSGFFQLQQVDKEYEQIVRQRMREADVRIKVGV
jgi:hypothetical protein